MTDAAAVQRELASFLRRGKDLARDEQARRFADEHLGGSDRLSPVEQLEIYREQFYLRHTASLVEDFPGVGGILGQSDWDRLVWDYLANVTPTSFDLGDLGAGLAAFAASRDWLAERRELVVDMARLEYAHLEVFDAPDAAPLDPAKLTAVPEDAWEHARLVTDPGLRLVGFRPSAVGGGTFGSFGDIPDVTGTLVGGGYQAAFGDPASVVAAGASIVKDLIDLAGGTPGAGSPITTTLPVGHHAPPNIGATHSGASALGQNHGAVGPPTVPARIHAPSEISQPPPLPENFIGPPVAGQEVVPSRPPGTSVDQNIQETLIVRHRLANNPMAQLSWFHRQVQNKGPWDYKQRGRQYENFGNFNYGATGAALGISRTTLLREAGRAQVEAGTSRPGWGDPGWRINPWGGTPPYGDDPADQYWIDQGIRYYHEVFGRSP